jgi:hypothetical protein
MIEKIYIPTIRRANKQITYEKLPQELRDRVVMVIESKEKHEYNYPCEYLEIPEEFVGQWTQLAQTRKFIHQNAGKIKYAMFDDDIVFYKRNTKYFNGISDMETSKRESTHEEIFHMFDTASKWLDEQDIGIVGLSKNYLPPGDVEYSDTKDVYSCIFLDGKKIYNIVDKVDTSIRVAEDLLFLFDCISNGINTRRSNEFLYFNKSEAKEFQNCRPIWNDMFSDSPKNVFETKEHYEALEYIRNKYPNGITFFQENGVTKHKKHLKDVYKPLSQSSLDNFFV